MKKNRVFSLVTVALIVTTFCVDAQKLPYITVNREGVKQLIVDEKPFIFLSGELHNSTASNLRYLSPRMKDLKERYLNSVIATVSWELFEPREGEYDYALVKGIIDQARENDMKLILIWFGTWKNTWSTYAPEWVKTNIKRFPRMQIKNGINSGALSAFGENTRKADAKAFAELMRYIREYDAKEQTVLMMQVENETGLLGTSRDRSNIAEAAFKEQVPVTLIEYLKQNKLNLTSEMKNMLQLTGNKLTGTWREVFGYGADEVFSAWYVSQYVEDIILAGKAEYAIPMYVNAWLDGSFSKDLVPNYPSGGPVSKMFDVWRAGAPSIDLYGADVYLDDFKKVCDQYTQQGNPLFLPELAPSVRQAAYVYYALGRNAMCFAPFAIDGFNSETAAVVARSYQSLKGFLPFFSQHCGKDRNIGLLYTGREEEICQLGNYRIQVHYNQQRNENEYRSESGGLILQTDKDEFFICGFGMQLSFYPVSEKSDMQIEFLLHEEGSFDDGVWHSERRMNGDELSIRMMTPSIRKVKFHIYK
mgnify:FL=1